MNRNSYTEMLGAVQAFHDRHNFKERGGEDLTYRVALVAEELGEISACVTKGKPQGQLAEEIADLLILTIGAALSAEFDLNRAFWEKIDRIMGRKIDDGQRTAARLGV